MKKYNYLSMIFNIALIVMVLLFSIIASISDTVLRDILKSDHNIYNSLHISFNFTGSEGDFDKLVEDARVQYDAVNSLPNDVYSVLPLNAYGKGAIGENEVVLYGATSYAYGALDKYFIGMSQIQSDGSIPAILPEKYKNQYAVGDNLSLTQNGSEITVTVAGFVESNFRYPVSSLLTPEDFMLSQTDTVILPYNIMFPNKSNTVYFLPIPVLSSNANIGEFLRNHEYVENCSSSISRNVDTDYMIYLSYESVLLKKIMLAFMIVTFILYFALGIIRNYGMELKRSLMVFCSTTTLLIVGLVVGSIVLKFSMFAASAGVFAIYMASCTGIYIAISFVEVIIKNLFGSKKNYLKRRFNNENDA